MLFYICTHTDMICRFFPFPPKKTETNTILCHSIEPITTLWYVLLALITGYKINKKCYYENSRDCFFFYRYQKINFIFTYLNIFFFTSCKELNLFFLFLSFIKNYFIME